MNKLDCNLAELVNMLVTAKGTLKSSKDSILAVERTPFKRKSQRKKKISLQKSRRRRASLKRALRRKLWRKKSVSTITPTITEGKTIHFTWRV